MANDREDAVPRKELLTYAEMPHGIEQPDYPMDLKIGLHCSREAEMDLPSRGHMNDSHIERYELDGNWIEIGVWEDPQGKYMPHIHAISKNMSSDLCRLGRNGTDLKSRPEEAGQIADADWRFRMLDLGDDVVAFQGSQWATGGADTASSADGRKRKVYWNSTARAYGMVDGKLVRIAIERSESVLPPEGLLRRLWEAQAAKIRYYERVGRSLEFHARSSDSVSGMSAHLPAVPVTMDSIYLWP